MAASSQATCKQKFYVPESKNQICGFVGNVDADSGLTCYPHWTPDFATLEQIFDQKIMFFLEKRFFWIFDKSAGSADNNEKMLVKVGV